MTTPIFLLIAAAILLVACLGFTLWGLYSLSEEKSLIFREEMREARLEQLKMQEESYRERMSAERAARSHMQESLRESRERREARRRARGNVSYIDTRRNSRGS